MISSRSIEALLSPALVELLSLSKTIVRCKQAAASIEEAHDALLAVQEVSIVHSVGPLGCQMVGIALQGMTSVTAQA